MECSCEIEYYDSDCGSITLHNSKTVTARQEHKCGECHRVIPIKEKYEYVTYNFEGKFWKEKTCSDCLSARKQFYPSGGGFMFGGIWEEINEFVNDCQGDIPEDCIVELTPISRARLCDLVEKHSKST